MMMMMMRMVMMMMAMTIEIHKNPKVILGPKVIQLWPPQNRWTEQGGGEQTKGGQVTGAWGKHVTGAREGNRWPEQGGATSDGGATGDQSKGLKSCTILHVRLERHKWKLILDTRHLTLVNDVCPHILDAWYLYGLLQLCAQRGGRRIYFMCWMWFCLLRVVRVPSKQEDTKHVIEAHMWRRVTPHTHTHVVVVCIGRPPRIPPGKRTSKQVGQGSKQASKRTSKRHTYTYIHIYIYICVHVYAYIYIYTHCSHIYQSYIGKISRKVK